MTKDTSLNLKDLRFFVRREKSIKLKHLKSVYVLTQKISETNFVDFHFHNAASPLRTHHHQTIRMLN